MKGCGDGSGGLSDGFTTLWEFDRLVEMSVEADPRTAEAAPYT